MVSHIDKAKEERERRIFGLFAQSCRLKIDLASIVNRRPPEPDIYCELETGGALQFELVEVLDNVLVSNIAGDIGLQRALNEGALAQRVPLFENRGVLAGVNFDFSATDKKKLAVVPNIIREAAQIPAGFEGWWPIRDIKAIRVASRLFVTRGGDFKSEFHVGSYSSFADPIIEKVGIKGKKKYTCANSIDLLAYYDRQPVFPGSLDSPRLSVEIQHAVAGSQFSRVWVYGSQEGRVVEVQVRQ